MSIKEALKKIYKAMSGGTSSTSKSISGILNDISTVASGGSGGGSGVLKVTMTKDENNKYHLDKSWQEIKDAYDAGSFVYTDIYDDGDPSYTIYHKIDTVWEVAYDTHSHNYELQTYYESLTFTSTSPDEWIDPV